METKTKDLVIATLIGCLVLSGALVIGHAREAVADRTVNANEVIVISDDIRKTTTTVSHVGDPGAAGSGGAGGAPGGGADPGKSKSKSKGGKTKGK